MKSYNFQDIDGTDVTISLSSLATQEAVRVYLKNKKGEDEGHLHLSIRQAQILIAALEEMIESF